MPGYSEDVLSEYVLVLVANKKSHSQAFLTPLDELDDIVNAYT